MPTTSQLIGCKRAATVANSERNDEAETVGMVAAAAQNPHGVHSGGDETRDEIRGDEHVDELRPQRVVEDCRQRIDVGRPQRPRGVLGELETGRQAFIHELTARMQNVPNNPDTMIGISVRRCTLGGRRSQPNR